MNPKLKDNALRRSHKRSVKACNAVWIKCNRCNTPLAPSREEKPCHYCAKLTITTKELNQ